MHRLLILAVVALVSWMPSAICQELRVLAYNIHHGEGTDGKFDLDRIAKLITAQEPDLVALQEIDVKTARASGVDQAAELARLTGMHYRFGRFMKYDGGEYGQMVLSKHPILSHENLKLPEGPEPRTALIVGQTSSTHKALVLRWKSSLRHSRTTLGPSTCPQGTLQRHRCSRHLGWRFQFKTELPTDAPTG